MEQRYNVMKEAAIKAGRAISKLDVHITNTKEGSGNFVTNADITSEEIIFKKIKKYFPSDSILSEETKSQYTSEQLLQLPHLWVIDPIDGTNNFKNDRNYSCISVGYAENGVVKAGCVYDIGRKFLFSARENKGTYLENMTGSLRGRKKRKLHIGNQKGLTKANIGTDFAYQLKDAHQNLDMLRLTNSSTLFMRGSSTLQMCDVAAGRTDLYFYNALKPWDNAAAMIIVQESGGTIRDFEGNENNFLSPNLVFGNEWLVTQFIQVIK